MTNQRRRPTRRQQQRRNVVMATSAAAAAASAHPLRRHLSMQNIRLLNGSSATTAAAATAAATATTTAGVPSKISQPSEAFVLDELDRKEQIAIPTQNSDPVSVASLSLPAKLAGDVAVAVAVTFAVSPFLTVVDKAIVESANGSKSIVTSALDSVANMLRHPIRYVKSPTFLLMWAVYSATYSTANAFKTLEEHEFGRNRKSSQPMAKVGTFVGTTMVNSGTFILKDRAYARMFSSASSVNTATQSFPRTTYAMWMMRDLSVIGSSFILPDVVSQRLVDEYGMDSSRAHAICQLTLPVAAQFVAGPFHFLGLDYFNRQQRSVATVDRARALYEGIGPVIAARIARIAPGYGIGGVWNTKLRTSWRAELLEKAVQPAQQSETTPFTQPSLASLMRLVGVPRVQGSLA